MSNNDTQLNIFNLGVNYKSANVSFRESLFIEKEKLKNVLQTIKEQYQLSEVAIMSTCNRFEMFGVSKSKIVSDETLYDIFINSHIEKAIDPAELKENSYIQRDSTAVHHLMSVASSLDSLVVGETQITGQFKDSLELSKQSGTLGSVLLRLGQDALSCSKKVRRNTAIGAKTVSISHTAIDLAKKIFEDISEQKVLIVGAGEMARLAGKYASTYNPKSLMIANRTLENAKKLTEELETGSYHGLDELPNLLKEATIVISSTGSSNFVITHNMLENALKSSDTGTVFLCDIAIPRDIDPSCNELENVFLFEVDDLQQVVNENIEERNLAAKEAKHFVDTTTSYFMDWVKSYDIKPVLQNAKAHFEELIERELTKTFSKSIFQEMSQEQKQSIHSLKSSIAGKLVSDVAIAIGKQETEQEKNSLVTAISKIFNNIDNS